MFNFIGKFFDSNEKEINKLKPIVLEINLFEEKFRKLKDKDFPQKTKEFKERVAGGESLDILLPEAFALVREASKRSIGQRHYDVQLMAGITLASGKIAEQKTGEGKTLSSVPALYLRSLTGRGVHLVTVNDYLARRDAGWMGPIFNFLGVTVSSIINEQSFIFDPTFTNSQTHDFRLSHLKPITRRQAYKTDITYGINSEFGFDYLRDNMASDIEETVQREYYYAVVDEVDSVLIDEARTPHVISAPDESPTQKYYEYANLVDKLNPDIDYKVDEKLRTAHLTDHGIGKIERLYGISNIYEKDFNTVYHLEAALKARTLFKKEKDYIVKDNQVILVDEFTGRLMMGRRLSEGLHQAIEAKENVSIQRESRTMATVSLQNYFRMYEKLAGMTGTAVTEAREFHKIYNLDVVVVPTNKPMIRQDNQDMVYKSGRAKYSAVANEIEKAHKVGQPVLIGTTSIDKNELISELLRRHGIKHEVLNAKNHEQEARIISRAGEKGAVTVATNMAGRGVDIILGGENPNPKEHTEVVKLGGLYVIGTERHESRRIDNQLRGRSGRQGDPGASRFFVALDDDIMRLFGGDTISNIMTRFNMPEDVPLQHIIVSKAIEQAQTKVEGFNFDIRKHLVDYDDVLNKQREIIYKRRKTVLENKQSLEKEIVEKIDSSIAAIVSIHTVQVSDDKPVDEKIIEDFTTIIPFDDSSKKQLTKQLEIAATLEQKINFLTNIAHDVYGERKKQLGEKLMSQIERYAMLSIADTLWMDHLDAVENLRGGIGLRGYGQRDPLVEYKNEAYTMFEQLIAGIDDEIVHRIYKIQVAMPPQMNMDKKADSRGNQRQSIPQSVNIDTSKRKLGRNDPCWCGAKKSDGTPIKYKHCHYPN